MAMTINDITLNSRLVRNKPGRWVVYSSFICLPLPNRMIKPQQSRKTIPIRSSQGNSGQRKRRKHKRTESRSQCSVCRRPLIEEPRQENSQCPRTDKAGELLDILKRLVQPRQHRSNRYRNQQ